MKVRLDHSEICSQGLIVGKPCDCEPVRWVRLDDVLEALEKRYSPQLDKVAAALTEHPSDCVLRAFQVVESEGKGP